MAQLKDSVVQGSLRVTDTIFSNQLTVNDMLTANKISTTGGIVSYTTNGDTAFNALGIIFSKTDNTVVGRIGMSTSQTLGIYAGGTIFIRPNSASAASTADGVKVDGNGLAPTVTNMEDLGTTSLKWKNVYATTFNGALSGNATTASRANLTTTTNAIAYYSGTNGVFANGSYVKYLAHTKVTAGTSTTEKFIDGLHISGTAYNAAADVISGVDGKLSYGDAGAQIRFTDSDQSGAILFHRWDSGGNSVSFNFLSNQSTANVGALVRAGAFAAVERAAIGQLTTDTNYVLKVNGITQINGSIYLKHNTINIQDTGNKNGITSDTGYYIWARDKNDIDYGILQMFAKTDGQVSLYIGVRNYSGTTNRGWKGLQMYANKSGGASVTSTCGTWTYQNGYLNIKNTTVNLKNESNGVSSNTVMYLYSKDTNDYVFGTFETAALTNGNVYAYMGVNNRNTSGTAQGWSGIKITQTKANVITYTITDPTAFKTALSLNNVENTAISTWTGTTNVGTLKGLTLSGTAADSYVAAFAGTTDASSSSAAAVTIAGGLAVAKSLYVGTPSADKTFPSQGIHVWDARTADISPSALDNGANFYFINKNQPHTSWSAGIYVRGWSGSNYAAWCLVGPATDADQSTAPLYVRTSKNATTWGSYRKIYDTSNKPSSSDVGLGNVSNNSNLNGATGTKGDMIYWSAKDTPARLGIGTANHILIASSNGPVWTVNASLASATSTTANTDAWDTLTLGNNVNRTSTSAHSSGKIVLYGTATAGTTITHGSWSGSGLTVGGTIEADANIAFIASGKSDPEICICFNTREGTSGLGPTSRISYTTTEATWAYIFCQIPTIKNTYATAGNINSTVTHNYTSYPTRFSFRQFSYAAATAEKKGYYEEYMLPTVNPDRTNHATYDIITTKNLSNITSVNGATFAGTAAASYIATFSGTTDATSSTGAVIINGGLLVKKKLYVKTATTLASTLSVTGATTLSGALTVAGVTTLNGKFVGSSNNYGATLPSSGQTTGQIFFQTSDPVYELPTGGTANQALIKVNGTNRNVTWGGPYLPLSGGTMTGETIFTSANGIRFAYSGATSTYKSVLLRQDESAFWMLVSTSQSSGNNWATPSGGHPFYITMADGYCHAARMYGAVWNDYAEFRKDNVNEILEMGRCVCEVGDGSLRLTKHRLEYGCEIISDTYGFAIGEDKDKGYNTPVASSGRVLAYPFEELEIFRSHIGWPVCSGPNGTVSIMTEDEERRYPSRIIGTISEIPSYEEWGSGKVKVNGRVWIRIR